MDSGIGLKLIQGFMLNSYQYTLTAVVPPAPDERDGKQKGQHLCWPFCGILVGGASFELATPAV
jgi:hypothetical protein